MEEKMRVFLFNSDDLYWAVSGQDREQAKNYLFDFVGEMKITKIEEIPESKWDDKTINIWEDNDLETEPFKVSIREELFNNEPSIIYTNDLVL
jgi:hypothetical protein